MAALIGALRVSLSADTAKFEQGMKRAERQAKTSSSAISKSMGMLKAGVAGLAAGLSVGMLAGVIKGALDYAGSLGEVAAQLGVTTKELQVFRFASGQMGVTTEEADKGLGKLTLSLSKAASGSKPTIAAFQSVGVSLADIKSKGAVEIFGMMADGMKKTGGASANAAAGVALMSRNFQKFVPLLDGGSAGMNQLSAAAEKLGIVLSDEQIRNADDTADKLDALKTVLMANVAGVVANNASAIVSLANSLVYLVAQIGNAITWWRNFNAEFQGDMAELRGDEGSAARYRGEAYQSGKNPSRAGRSITVKLGSAKPVAGAGGMNRGAVPQFLKGGGGKGKKAGKGPADTSVRDAHQFDQDLRRAQMDVLRASQDLATGYVERNSIAVQILDAERAAYKATLDYEVAAKEKTAAQAEQLLTLYDTKDSLERQKIIVEEQTQAAEDSVHLDQVSMELDRDRLESEAQLATTAEDERRIRLQILDHLYRTERARLEAVLADEKASDLAKEEARRRLSGMSETYGNDKEGVMRDTRGPLEEWAASVPQTAAEINEAFQSIQADGLEGLSDAMMDVISGTKSLGDAFQDMAKGIIADIIRMTIRMMIFRVISGIIGGGLGGSSLGALSGSQAAIGMAHGGSINVMGRGGTDRNVLAMNGVPIARVSKGERIDVSNDNGGGGAQEIVVHVSASEDFNVRVERLAGGVVAQAAPMIVRASAKHTMRSLQRPKLA